MFNVNDCVMYGTTGVCEVTDITKDKLVGNVKSDYYVLRPVFENNATIMTPIDNPKVLIRSLITQSEADELIENMPDEEIEWIPNDRQRNEIFKNLLHTGSCSEWMKIIKAIHKRKTDVTATGKKLRQSDENFMKSAEKLLYEEFSYSLKIPFDDVKPYILSHCN